MRLTRLRLSIIGLLSLFYTSSFSQIDDDQMGAWYMYFWNTRPVSGIVGFQGDIQYRNWNIIGDLEQLLIRGGITIQPKGGSGKFTFGYASITTGEFGDGDATVHESRIYQEFLLPHKAGSRFYFTHRFRYEQRWVETQDVRTRWRYNLFLNIPLNKPALEEGTVYFAFYNELFINGQKSIGNGRRVELFDRNRTYLALGYGLSDRMRVQFGVMRQTINPFSKGQLQLSLHHTY